MTGPLMYTDLADWWPLLSPPSDYVDEAAMIAGLLRAAMPPAAQPRRPTLLELGSGGGHNAVHLAEYVEPVLVDLSPRMLDVSRRLNPGVEHHVGDMRDVRLGRTVDAVLVHDALGYLLTETDLDAAFATARAHLEPGGVAVLVPDHTRETYRPGTECGGEDAPDGSGARYLRWNWDPDPDDTWVQAEFSYLLRAADGAVTGAAESHRLGLFPLATWVESLQRNGFDPTTVTQQDEESDWTRHLFVAVAR